MAELYGGHVDEFAEMIEVNLAKEQHRAVKTAVSFV